MYRWELHSRKDALDRFVKWKQMQLNRFEEFYSKEDKLEKMKDFDPEKLWRQWTYNYNDLTVEEKKIFDVRAQKLKEWREMCNDEQYWAGIADAFDKHYLNPYKIRQGINVDEPQKEWEKWKKWHG